MVVEALLQGVQPIPLEVLALAVLPEPLHGVGLCVPECGVPGKAKDDVPKYDMFNHMSIVKWHKWYPTSLSNPAVGARATSPRPGGRIVEAVPPSRSLGAMAEVFSGPPE